LLALRNISLLDKHIPKSNLRTEAGMLWSYGILG
jgi:hypothetical protein